MLPMPLPADSSCVQVNLGKIVLGVFCPDVLIEPDTMTIGGLERLNAAFQISINL